ncbi:MAG: flippase-like domain-containing protein [Candidatus Bathyarchaeota archaeon]|nr:flippase-like domain-containing protein [Candidatus Bathyarchaeota archaeon]
MKMAVSTSPIISPSVKKWILLAALIGYTALVLYLFYYVGIGQLFVVISKVNVAFYVFAIISVIISLTLHALVWFELLKALSIKLGFRRTFNLYWVGIFIDNLIPGGWSGDLFKAYLLNRDPNVQSGKAVASVVAKNMYEAIFNLGNMLVGVALLLLNYRFEGVLLITIGGIMIMLTLPLLILLAASFKPSAAQKVVNAFFDFLTSNGKKRPSLVALQSKILKALGDYHEGMVILLKNPKMLTKPMILSFFAWGFEILTLLLVFASLGQLIPVDKVIIVRAIGGNIEAQGYAFIGYAQIITSEIYKALGVPFALGVSVALLGGVVIFWLKTAISYVAFHHVVFSPRTKLPVKETEPVNPPVNLTEENRS